MKPQLNKINTTKQVRFIYQNSQEEKRNCLKTNILAANSANRFNTSTIFGTKMSFINYILRWHMNSGQETCWTDNKDQIHIVLMIQKKIKNLAFSEPTIPRPFWIHLAPLKFSP